uniref:SH3 domain and tetratricopeptide repeats 1 n=1 Tax=Callorhinchus milii TaxID=7868 RepID=A0A4W3I613_CALMI
MESGGQGDAPGVGEFPLYTIEEERSSLISVSSARDRCLESAQEQEEEEEEDGSGHSLQSNSSGEEKLQENPTTGDSNTFVVADCNGKAAFCSSASSPMHWSNLTQNSVESDENSEPEERAVPVRSPSEENEVSLSLPKQILHDSSGMENRESELDRPEKDSLNSCSTLSLVESGVPTAISLKLIIKKQITRLPDTQLQETLRAKLRILENESGEVAALLSELSARLLSIHSDQDLILVTFKTFEEIWKFSTYYSLGFVGHCLENLLLDQLFWLNNLDDEDVRIEVQTNGESLEIMWKGLLLQDGLFFARCPLNLQKCEEVDLELKPNDFVVVADAKPSSKWAGHSLFSGKKGLLPKSCFQSLELLIPFHQWFFKMFTEDLGIHNDLSSEFSYPLGKGSCIAMVDYEGAGLEELSFQIGHKIEIIGLLIACMQWFLGKNETSGKIGFVKTNHVRPKDFTPLTNDLLFIDEAESSFFTEQEKFNEEDSMKLLKQLTRTDISNVYQMDKLGPLNPQYEDGKEQHIPSVKEMDLMKAQLKGPINSSEGTQCSISNNRSQATRKGSFVADNDSTLVSEEAEEQCFCINHTEGLDNPETFYPLLLFLNIKGYSKHFKKLYDSCFSFLKSTFHGYSDEEEVVHYLEVAREAARKQRMQWAQTRVCLLLGRMCAKKHKFSQARVYFEEAISLLKGEFADLFLSIAVYTNLVATYLKQNNKEKCTSVFEKIAALLLGIPDYICSTDMESEILKYVLRHAVLNKNQIVEARACFLLTKLYIHLQQYEDALPFIERLQFLKNSFMVGNTTSLDFHFSLGSLYSQKCLPNLALSCAKLSCSQHGRTLVDCLKSTNFVMIDASKLCGSGGAIHVIPTQVATYLKRALTLASRPEQDNICRTIYLSLSEIYKHHKVYSKAVLYMTEAINTEASVGTEEVIDAQISLACLHILNSQPSKAIVLLNMLLEYVRDSPVQRGVVYNMLAIAKRRVNNVKEAAENYRQALSISVETGLKFNQAIAQANFGFLCLWSKAYSLSEQLILKSIHLFSELPNVTSDENFIHVLIVLGQYYIDQQLKDKGIFYYEWALLIALKGNLIESQVQVTQLLCQFYSSDFPNEAQCIIYNEFLLSLTRKLADKEQEGHVLQNISQLYLSLGTERAFRSALEYTKRSLGIFIDLKKKEQEAYAWLQAGKIYYILRENELVDLYIQVAHDAAVSTEKLDFALEVFEAAGDVFFNGSWEREKAISFYRDRALPLAIKSENTNVELRLCNKLTELLMHGKSYAEALEFAQTALALSVSLGNMLNERIAYHRLAIIHQSLGQCELAEHFYLKALSLCSFPLVFDEETMYYVRVYIQLGDMTFYNLKDPHDAAGYYHLALAAAMDLGNKSSQLKICTRLATIYHNFLMDREMSLYFYQKARAFAVELNIRRINLSPAKYYKAKAEMPSKSHV